MHSLQVVHINTHALTQSCTQSRTHARTSMLQQNTAGEGYGRLWYARQHLIGKPCDYCIHPLHISSKSLICHFEDVQSQHYTDLKLCHSFCTMIRKNSARMAKYTYPDQDNKTFSRVLPLTQSRILFSNPTCTEALRCLLQRCDLIPKTSYTGRQAESMDGLEDMPCLSEISKLQLNLVLPSQTFDILGMGSDTSMLSRQPSARDEGRQKPHLVEQKPYCLAPLQKASASNATGVLKRKACDATLSQHLWNDSQQTETASLRRRSWAEESMSVESDTASPAFSAATPHQQLAITDPTCTRTHQQPERTDPQDQKVLSKPSRSPYFLFQQFSSVAVQQKIPKQAHQSSFAQPRRQAAVSLKSKRQHQTPSNNIKTSSSPTDCNTPCKTHTNACLAELHLKGVSNKAEDPASPCQVKNLPFNPWAGILSIPLHAMPVAPTVSFIHVCTPGVSTQRETGMVAAPADATKAAAAEATEAETYTAPVSHGEHLYSSNQSRLKPCHKAFRSVSCEEMYCTEMPHFNFKGESHGQFCSQHCKEGMVDVINMTCELQSCRSRPEYNYSGASAGRFCHSHKLEGMGFVMTNVSARI